MVYLIFITNFLFIMATQEFFSHETLSNEQYWLLKKIQLPEDILRVIYQLHFAPEVIFEKKHKLLMIQIASPECQRLEYQRLEFLVRSIVYDSSFCKFMCDNNQLFAKIFNDHFILIKKNFARLNHVDSFCLTWLMHLYH